MKRILIVYDTKGGSTWEIIGWIRDGAISQGASVDIKSVREVDNLDYDLIVTGSPIYGEQPMGSIINFLTRDDLTNKNIALFVVCFAGVFGLRNFMVRRYLDEMRSICKGHVVSMTSFDAATGPWRKLNREICYDYGREIAGAPVRRPKVVGTA
ncbi:flavodoxin domain-containing protein [Methanocella arvoryzae]|nr:flavodoxin domain-containing protein [Methanocella arvoryzae]